MYTKQLTQPRKIRWRCVKRTTNCKASLTTTLDLEDPQLLSAHNHDPSDSSVSAVKCRAQMKQQAKQSSEKSSQIYTQAAAEIALTPGFSLVARNLSNVHYATRVLTFSLLFQILSMISLYIMCK